MPTAQGDAEQLTCADADAPPDEPTPDYLYTGSYENGGNSYDGPSGCMVDGQPVPCDLMMLLLRFGSGVGREGGSIRVLTDYSGRDPREFPPTMIRAIQIPGSRINTNLDLDALRNKIKEYNTERCQEFVKDLLTQAGKEGGGRRRSYGSVRPVRRCARTEGYFGRDI